MGFQLRRCGRFRRRTGWRAAWGRWSSATERRRRRRRSCCMTTSTSCTGWRRSSTLSRARRWRPSARDSCSIGVEDNSVLLFSELMDSASLFLTANCDTVYFLSFVDLTDGPMVLDVPPLGPPSGILGTIDDMWFRWVTDFGLPGPDRAQGGRYLIVGPGYDGPLPDSGFHVSHARTTRVCVLGRAFMVDNDPRVPVEAIRSGFRISPYVPGAQGTAVATFLAGEAPWAPHRRCRRPASSRGPARRSTRSRRTTSATGRSSTRLVQQEPAGAGDPEIAGPARGGRDRQGPAVQARRADAQDPRRRCRGRQRHRPHHLVRAATRGRLRLLPRLGVVQHAVRRRLRVPRPAPADHRRRRRSPPRATGTQAQLAHRVLLPGHRHHPRDVHAPDRIGSQYLSPCATAAGSSSTAARTYRLTLPPGIPESRFWSVMVYDHQTRSMLQTGQPKPDARQPVRHGPANPDGSTDVYFGPTAPTEARGELAPDRPGQRLLRRSCGSTTRSSRSSTRPGGPARSNRTDN